MFGNDDMETRELVGSPEASRGAKALRIGLGITAAAAALVAANMVLLGSIGAPADPVGRLNQGPAVVQVDAATSETVNSPTPAKVKPKPATKPRPPQSAPTTRPAAPATSGDDSGKGRGRGKGSSGKGGGDDKPDSDDD